MVPGHVFNIVVCFFSESEYRKLHFAQSNALVTYYEHLEGWPDVKDGKDVWMLFCLY